MYIAVILFGLWIFRLVTPYSRLDVRVQSQNTIRAPTLLGQVSIELYNILLENQGKCKNPPHNLTKYIKYTIYRVVGGFFFTVTGTFTLKFVLIGEGVGEKSLALSLNVEVIW